MTPLFAGGELEAFKIVAGTPDENIDFTRYDTNCARCAIRMSNNCVVETPAFTASSSLWVHWESHHISGYGISSLVLVNGSGTALFRVRETSADNLQMQYWNGSAWTNIGSAVSVVGYAQRVIDIKLVGGSSGSAEFYLGGTFQTSGSASMTSVTNITKAQWGESTLSQSTWLSQMIVADTSTIGHKFYLRPPTGNGVNTAWTGDCTSVDELAITDADYIESGTASQVETFTHAAITLPSGQAVKAVVVSARAAAAAGGPQNMQFAIRRGSTDYFSSSVSGLASGYAPFVGIFVNDPSTSAQWTSSNAGSVSTEFGLKSIA